MNDSAEQPKGIKITVEDLETGDTESVVIWDTYFIVCAGSCYVAHQNVFPTSGTHQLTIKGSKKR